MKKVGSIVKKQNGELSIYHTKEVPYYITYFDDLHLDLLKIDECGWQAESFLEINEEQKNYYVIHYVVKGKGYFVVDGKKMIVERIEDLFCHRVKKLPIGTIEKIRGSIIGLASAVCLQKN